MSDQYDLDALMDRLVEMEKESLASLVGTDIDAVKYHPYEQEAFPYWTNRITGMTPVYLAQDIVQYPFRVTARLVIAHFTEGYRGETATKTYQYIPAVLHYFKDRPGMNSTAHPTQMDDVFRDFEIVDFNGPFAFQNNGIGATQVGFEFVFTLPVLDQQYR